MMARATAIGLEDATPARFEATMKVMLVSVYDGDASRIAAATAACRANLEDCDTVGWDEAAVLLEQALQRLRDVGADVDEPARTAFVCSLRRRDQHRPAQGWEPARSPPRAFSQAGFYRQGCRASLRLSGQPVEVQGANGDLGHERITLVSSYDLSDRAGHRRAALLVAHGLLGGA